MNPWIAFVIGLVVATLGYFFWEKFDITGKIAALFGKGEKYVETEINKVKVKL